MVDGRLSVCGRSCRVSCAGELCSGTFANRDYQQFETITGRAEAFPSRSQAICGHRLTSVRQGRDGRLVVVAATSASPFRHVSQPPPVLEDAEKMRRENLPAPHQSYSSTMTRTPTVRPFVLGSPPGLLGGSHTQPANSGLAAYGCYRLFGPARISKRGDCLVARLLPGARLELLSGGGAGGSTSNVGAAATMADAEAWRAHQGPRTRTMTMAEAAAGLAAEADGWDVRCACSGSDGDREEEDGDGGGGLSDDGAVTECILVAAYVELGGSASSVDMVDVALQPAVHHHNGHTYLSVRNLPPSAIITLSADGDLSHPVNVTPPERPTERQASAAVPVAASVNV